MTTVERIPAAALEPEHVQAWEGMLETAPLYRSPFLAPGWTQLVGRCRDDVYIGVLRRDGRIAAILPYESEEPGVARPVGSVFNDVQAVIAGPDTPWNVADWMDGLDLKEWRFEAHMARQRQLHPHEAAAKRSFAVDLSRPFAEYRAWLTDWHPSLLPELDRKFSRIERDVGPISFQARVKNHQLLDHALTIKAKQWADSGWPGRFFTPWEYKMMHDLLEWESASFSGIFSVLWAGDQPVAFHFGMCGRKVWHGWTIVHDPAFKRYSPGMLIHLRMFEAGNDLGFDEFDLGVGEYPHKVRMHTHQMQLVAGIVRRENVG